MPDSSDSNSESVSNTTLVNEDKKPEPQATRRQFLSAASKVLAVSVATEAAAGAGAGYLVTKAKHELKDKAPPKDIQKAELTQSAVDGAISGALGVGLAEGIRVAVPSGNSDKSAVISEATGFTRRDIMKISGAAVAGSAIGMTGGRAVVEFAQKPEDRSRVADIACTALGGFAVSELARSIMQTSIEKRESLIQKSKQERIKKLEKIFADEPEEGISR